jgi:hypothetical protein
MALKVVTHQKKNLQLFYAFHHAFENFEIVFNFGYVKSIIFLLIESFNFLFLSSFFAWKI